MTLKPEELRQGYAELAQASRRLGDIRVLDAGFSSAEGEALLGLSGLGQRLMLVPVSDSGPRDTGSRGLTLDFVDLEENGEVRTYLRVTCEDVRLNDLFTSVVIDMAGAVESSPANPSTAIRHVLQDYRRMLARRPRALLDEQALAALLAELLVLEEVLRAGGSVEQWVGPMGQRHDITGPSGAIEVKSTLSAEDRTVRVNGLRQLEAPADGQLFLHLIRFELTAGGESVPDVVDRLIVNGADQELLVRRLWEVGYHAADREEYEGTGFDRFAEETHRVDEGFPRLITTGLPHLDPVITRISYDIDLSLAPLDPIHDGLTVAVHEILEDA